MPSVALGALLPPNRVSSPHSNSRSNMSRGLQVLRFPPTLAWISTPDLRTALRRLLSGLLAERVVVLLSSYVLPARRAN
jgi:hypothetical protein